MTTDTAALVRQMREALQGFLDITTESRGVDGYHLNGAVAEWGEFVEVGVAESAIAAADQWLAQPPANQCGETCERAALCPACALGLTQAEPTARRYAYSLDGGETYHGSELTPEDALGAAHDELATEHEAGTTHQVHIARLVPGVEILREQGRALARAAK